MRREAGLMMMMAVLACGRGGITGNTDGGADTTDAGNGMSDSGIGTADGGTGAADGGTVTPKAGDRCNTFGFLCSSPSLALECRGGAWVALPCRGANGCQLVADAVTCDLRGSVAGDACASSAETRGLCTTDGKGTLECMNGTFVKTNTCRTCTVSGDTVICQP